VLPYRHHAIDITDDEHSPDGNATFQASKNVWTQRRRASEATKHVWLWCQLMENLRLAARRIFFCRLIVGAVTPDTSHFSEH
jgi:hypothetical protein